MKTLSESIIGKRGNTRGSWKTDLQPGYIVRYRGDDDAIATLGMYFDYHTTMRIQRTKSCLYQMNGEGGFFATDNRRDLDWMPICRYNDNLTHKNDSDSYRRYDIVEVWPIKTQPQLLDQESLEHLIQGKSSIKINQ